MSTLLTVLYRLYKRLPSSIRRYTGPVARGVYARIAAKPDIEAIRAHAATLERHQRKVAVIQKQVGPPLDADHS